MAENPMTAQPPVVSFHFKTKHHLDNEIAFELTEEELENLMAKLAALKKKLAAHKSDLRPQAPAEPKALEEVLLELAGEVPEKEWEKLPKDLDKNLDHYVYGLPPK